VDTADQKWVEIVEQRWVDSADQMLVVNKLQVVQSLEKMAEERNWVELQHLVGNWGNLCWVEWCLGAR
jgi:hypothetical protein